jgi:hypothetical protein
MSTLSSPQVTELGNASSRLLISRKAEERKMEQRTAQAIKPSTDDSEALIALVLADPDNISVPAEIEAQNNASRHRIAAIDEALHSLRPKMAKAKYDAATAYLARLKPEHDKIVGPLASALADAAKHWVQLSNMAQGLKELDTGFRNGVCDLLPNGLLGFANRFSPLADFLNKAVAAGYIKSNDVPKELRHG